MIDDILQFDSSEQALRYAFATRNGYGRPAINRMADLAAPGGDGLTPNEQSAQAGMILAEVRALGRVPEHVLLVRYTPRTVVCQCQAACCSGRRINEDWVFAASYLSEQLRTGPLYGRNTTVAQRQDLIELALGTSRRKLADLAHAHGVHRDTFAAWRSRAEKWLLDVERKALKAFDDVAHARGWLREG